MTLFDYISAHWDFLVAVAVGLFAIYKWRAERKKRDLEVEEKQATIFGTKIDAMDKLIGRLEHALTMAERDRDEKKSNGKTVKKKKPNSKKKSSDLGSIDDNG